MTTAERTTDKRTGSRTYTHPRTGDKLVSVTTVLSETDGKRYLVDWSARLAAEYAIDNLDMLARVKVTRGRQQAIDLAKDQARQARERKADAGTYVHSVAEALILWAASPEGTGSEITLPVLPDHLQDALYDGEPLESVTDWMITGFLNWVSAFCPEFEAAEMSVFSLKLGVAGTMDMIVGLKNMAIGPAGRLIPDPGNRIVLCVDIKTGRHLDVTMPEQIGAYRRMEEALLPLGDMAPMPETDAGAVLHLRPEHDDGYKLILVAGAADELAFARFLGALDLVKGRKGSAGKPGKVVYALRADGTMPSPRLADLDGEGYGRVLGPLIDAGFGDLEDLAWRTAGDLLACKRVGPKAIVTIRRMLADHGLHLAGEAEGAVA